MIRHGRLAVLIPALCSAGGVHVVSAAEAARNSAPLQEVVIVAPYAAAIDRDLIAGNVQSATAESIEGLQPLDLTELLNRSFGSVHINHAQNNPLQPDVNFRGFTASPLLGLPPGLTVYQNGVRVNEPFGDTVNWDLIPVSAIGAVQLFGGANPVFGLNTLGGALSVQMKNGFDFEATEVEFFAGSFDRRAGWIQHGANNGRTGYYFNVDYFEEDGWRYFSRSDALRAFATWGLRGANGTLDISGAYADTKLRGNGASPAELLALDRRDVFTHPDITENRLAMLIVEGTRRLSPSLQLAGNVYYRDLDTDSFNGDGTVFEECEFDDDEFLVEDFDDVDGDGRCTFGIDDDIELVRDASGAPIEAEMDDEELDAINNISRRRQESYGASLQLRAQNSIAGRDNDLVIGAAFTQARARFASVVEVAQLLEDRSTSRTGIFADSLRTSVLSDVDTTSLYFADTLSLTPRTAVMLAGRFDETRIRLADRSGISPELNGSHSFERFNPSLGITFRATPAVTLYGSFSQSARAPTPVELACASEDAPCNLPNAFLADPPLDQVVATSVEAGARGLLGHGLQWHIGAFHTVNEDDILFQTTGGPQANVGFFDNVSDTRRAGLELSLAQRFTRFGWSVQYSLVDATFRDDFVVNSPNHPIFDDDPDSPVIVGDDKLLVRRGAKIPGIARHQANVGLDYAVNGRIRLGADLQYRSGVYLRGDEPNLLGKTDSFVVLNLRGELRLSDRLKLFARIENALDEDYETFGLLGEPDEVFEDFSDPRFYGAGPPFGAWVGVRFIP